jgi:hypothetical protein
MKRSFQNPRHFRDTENLCVVSDPIPSPSPSEEKTGEGSRRKIFSHPRWLSITNVLKRMQFFSCPPPLLGAGVRGGVFLPLLILLLIIGVIGDSALFIDR